MHIKHVFKFAIDIKSKNLACILILKLTILKLIQERYLFIKTLFFFGFEETSPPQKAHFVGPGEGVKPRLS